MGATYVVDGANLRCTMGTAQSSLKVFPPHRVELRGSARANIGDCKPFVNIQPFGTCNVTVPPKPCSPACAMWVGGKMDVLIENLPALLSNSMALCPAGAGVITISDDGQ